MGTAVAGVSWYEVAWLVDAGRIAVRDGDARAWLRSLSADHETLPITAAIAHRAAALGGEASFRKGPMDRLIHATAVEHGVQPITEDRVLRAFDAEVCRW